jgi:hypothetical protein
MPDISKCANQHCPLKNNCRRFLIEPSEYRQTYGEFKPYIKDEKIQCEYFWQVEARYSRKRYLKADFKFLSKLWGFNVTLPAMFEAPYLPILKSNRLGENVYSETELPKEAEIYDSNFLQIL